MKLTKQQTIESIDELIEIFDNASSYLTCIGAFSDYVFQSQFDQFTTSTEKTIASLEKIKESLQPETIDDESLQPETIDNESVKTYYILA